MLFIIAELEYVFFAVGKNIFHFLFEFLRKLYPIRFVNIPPAKKEFDAVGKTLGDRPKNAHAVEFEWFYVEFFFSAVYREIKKMCYASCDLRHKRGFFDEVYFDLIIPNGCKIEPHVARDGDSVAPIVLRLIVQSVLGESSPAVVVKPFEKRRGKITGIDEKRA